MEITAKILKHFVSPCEGRIRSKKISEWFLEYPAVRFRRFY
jgi:hypothetical protein